MSIVWRRHFAPTRRDFPKQYSTRFWVRHKGRTTRQRILLWVADYEELDKFCEANENVPSAKTTRLLDNRFLSVIADHRMSLAQRSLVPSHCRT